VALAITPKRTTVRAGIIFIDPFGPTSFPMELIGRIAGHERAEVLINFSYQPLNEWFLNDPAKHGRLDELFGDDRWRAALNIRDPRAKEQFLVEAYRSAMADRGWRGVTFRMVNRYNQTQYHLLFGTKNYLGMLAMKQAMWNVAPDGDFTYTDISDPSQARLFTGANEPDYIRELADQVFERRAGTTVSKEDLVMEDLAWHPTCIERHLTAALRRLEYGLRPPRIMAVENPDARSRRARTYPDGCRITVAAADTPLQMGFA
jgi:hypothetical protein